MAKKEEDPKNSSSPNKRLNTQDNGLKQQLSFLQNFLDTTKEPFRAAISKMAINRYIFDFLPMLEKNPKQQDLRSEYGTFTINDVTNILKIKSNTGHHHLNKLLEHNIIEIVKKEPYRNFHRYHYALSQEASVLVKPESEYKNEAKYQLLWHLVSLTKIIGELTINRAMLEPLMKQKRGAEIFSNWKQKTDVTLYHFLTSDEGRKRFLRSFKEVIKERGGFQDRAPRPTEHTFVSFLLLPEFENKNKS